ncbi:MAG: DUF58 domain-containing protein [Rhodobacteraceae bacterium]|nr:MAG: DUF58 domain-containing protein [Paracoccaceae bacterium]
MTPRNLRHTADALSAGFAPLLAEARQLAANISLGAHGRRRAGTGEEFWQYRAANSDDPFSNIDSRSSARSDEYFVRQHEWQNSQSVHLWIDRGASMQFRSTDTVPMKAGRAAALGLALSILLAKAGEKVGLMDTPEQPRAGMPQIENMAHLLTRDQEDTEYALPAQKQMRAGQKAVFLSDFLGDWDATMECLTYVANQQVEGCLIQVLDPIEEAFPFKGRTVLSSVNGQHKFETLRASALRNEYLERLAERKAALQQLADKTGWRFLVHHTDQSANSAMLWLYQALQGVRS